MAVFVLDKKIIDRYQKFEKDQIIDSLKKGVQQLTRLRHPRLLTVQHPLEESRWPKREHALTHATTKSPYMDSIAGSLDEYAYDANLGQLITFWIKPQCYHDCSYPRQIIFELIYEWSFRSKGSTLDKRAQSFFLILRFGSCASTINMCLCGCV